MADINSVMMSLDDPAESSQSPIRDEDSQHHHVHHHHHRRQSPAEEQKPKRHRSEHHSSRHMDPVPLSKKQQHRSHSRDADRAHHRRAKAVPHDIFDVDDDEAEMQMEPTTTCHPTWQRSGHRSRNLSPDDDCQKGSEVPAVSNGFHGEAKKVKPDHHSVRQMQDTDGQHKLKEYADKVEVKHRDRGRSREEGDGRDLGNHLTVVDAKRQDSQRDQKKRDEKESRKDIRNDSHDRSRERNHEKKQDKAVGKSDKPRHSSKERPKSPRNPKSKYADDPKQREHSREAKKTERPSSRERMPTEKSHTEKSHTEKSHTEKRSNSTRDVDSRQERRHSDHGDQRSTTRPTSDPTATTRQAQHTSDRDRPFSSRDSRPIRESERHHSSRDDRHRKSKERGESTKDRRNGYPLEERSARDRQPSSRDKDRAPLSRSHDQSHASHRGQERDRDRHKERHRSKERDKDRQRKDRETEESHQRRHNDRKEEHEVKKAAQPAEKGGPSAVSPRSGTAWYDQMNSDSSEEEEDEEVKVQRQLEEAARRRAAIQAKYSQGASPPPAAPSVGSTTEEPPSETDGDVMQTQKTRQDSPQNLPRPPEENRKTSTPNMEGSPSSPASVSFDMFSDSVTNPMPLLPGGKGDIPADDGFLPHLAPEMQAALHENWDDDDGYYAFRVGEVIKGDTTQQYKVIGKYGRGVFSIVLRCTDLTDPNGGDVALKVLRSNEHMAKCGLKEMEILKLLMEKDRMQKRHCVRYLGSFEHKNHLCIAFEPLKLNMRELLKKYGKENGKEVGITLDATKLYTKQMMIALKHLKDNQIIHADLKPDNILLNEKCNVLKLADFGSASYLHEGGITPYLVSRFYRPPEVILGLMYDCAVDMWSAAVTIFEMFTGRVCFPGRTNNNMLAKFMQLRGKFPNKMLKKAAFCNEHFNEQFQFKLREVDPVTKKEVVRLKTITGPEQNLKSILLAHMEEGEDRRPVLQFADFLEKALSLDPATRLKPEEALRHPFISDA